MALPPLLARGRGRGLAIVAALTVVQGLAAGAAAFATRTLFEAMHASAPLPVLSLAVLIGAGAVIAVARVAARQTGERIGQSYVRQIRAALFCHAAGMPARAVAERRAGFMSLRFVGDMTAFRNWLGLGLPRLIAGAVLLPVMFCVLWLLSPVFVLAAMPVIAVTLTLITLGGMRLVPLQRRLRARRARIAAEMAERMQLAPHLDRLGRREKELAHLDRRTDAMVRAALRHRLTAEILKALPDLAAGTTAVLIITAGHRAGLGTGNVAAALAAVGLLVSPLRDLGGVWNHWAAFRAAATKAEAALCRSQRELYRSRTSLPKGAVSVAFEDVALPSGTVLNVRVDPGAHVDLTICERDGDAIVDMLLGLDAPASGRLLLSGMDLGDLSRGSLRRAVQRIGAQPDILQGSLRRVLGLGIDRRPDDTTLERWCRDADLGHLLDRLGGLGGLVVEGGRNLTKGERLRIGVVRLMLQRPRLILLDPDVDDQVQEHIERHLAGRSVTRINMVNGQFAKLHTEAKASVQTAPFASHLGISLMEADETQRKPDQQRGEGADGLS